MSLAYLQVLPTNKLPTICLSTESRALALTLTTAVVLTSVFRRFEFKWVSTVTHVAEDILVFVVFVSLFGYSFLTALMLWEIRCSPGGHFADHFWEMKPYILSDK